MAEKAKESTASDAFALPEGRVINESLFVKDQFNDKAVPSYKIEIAVDEDSQEIEDLENKMMDYADDLWGDGAGDDESLVLPLISGNKLAKRREKKKKDGSAYKGMTVLRAKTIYNLEGFDGPGGVAVYDEEVEAIEPTNRSEVYRGCIGIAGVVMDGYINDDGEYAITLYLNSFQKTGAGEKLVSSADRSTLFKPRARSEGKKGKKGSSRRRRNRDEDDD